MRIPIKELNRIEYFDGQVSLSKSFLELPRFCRAFLVLPRLHVHCPGCLFY